MNNFKINDRVALTIEANKLDNLIRIGIVTDSYDDICMVQWQLFKWETNSTVYKKPVKYLFTELISEADCLAKQQQLDDEYKIIVDALSVDMVKAVEALQNAVKTAQQFNVKVAAIYEVQQQLFLALDSCGWRSSSLSC